MRAYLSRRYVLSASHRLYSEAYSDEKNLAVYGKCSNPHGHGHNYTIEVTVGGQVDPVTGMVYDLKALKDVLNREIVDPMDHRFLNYEVPPFDKVVPTVENVAIEIWRRLAPHFSETVRLKNVRLFETEDLYVDYAGE